MNLKDIVIYMKIYFNEKKYEILGNIYSKNSLNRIRNINIANNLHNETFSKYKNCNSGLDIVLIATGPTLNYFRPIPNAKYVGVNNAILYDKIKLNYYFAIDYAAVKDYLNKCSEYSEVDKFYGYYNIYHCVNMMIPESISLKHNAKRFVAMPYWSLSREAHYNFEPNIESFPIHCYATTAMAAMQFILYTNPKRIYLVGCDCANIGHFDDKTKQDYNFSYKKMKKEWKMLKDIRDWYYPETDIISINPVGLKGLFKDEYTDEFLKLKANYNEKKY